MNLCPYLIFNEAQSLPSRAQFQEPQGYTLGLFQAERRLGWVVARVMLKELAVGSLL